MDKGIVKVFYHKNGEERSFIRNDITLGQFFSAEPASRWDAEYWNPKFEDKFKEKFENKLGDYIKFTTYGQVGHREYSNKGIIHLSPANLPIIEGFITGIDFDIRKKYIIKDGHNDPPRSRLKYGDILLSNSGVAATGRPAIFLEKNLIVNISQHLNLIRLSNDINKFFVLIYLQTYFAQLQIERFKISVGPSALTFDEIKMIKIPSISSDIQKNIEKEYKKVYGFHKKAMIGKDSNNELAFNKNIKTAIGILKVLISKTEEVIIGKRKDVI